MAGRQAGFCAGSVKGLLCWNGGASWQAGGRQGAGRLGSRLAGMCGDPTNGKVGRTQAKGQGG